MFNEHRFVPHLGMNIHKQISTESVEIKKADGQDDDEKPVF